MKAKINLLLVDDSNVIVDYVKLMFRDADYIRQFDIAGTIVEAQVILRKEQTDLVILDIRLPDGSGIDLLKWLKQSYPDVEVIMFSNSSDKEHRLIAKGYGAELFFDKVTEFGQLPGAVSGHLARK